jgi:hypothetical protein
MDWRELAQRVLSLVPPVSPTQALTALEVPGTPHWIGVDSSGRPGLLICIAPGEAKMPLPPVRMRYVTVQHDLPCVLDVVGIGEVSLRGSLVQCSTLERSLHHTFAIAGLALAATMPQAPTADGAATQIERLITMFGQLERPSRQSVQGLWAELFLIADSSAPALMLSAWHADPMDRLDFSASPTHLEVKSYSSGRRIHHFRLRQLEPPSGERIVVVSVHVESSGGGVSIGQLMSRIKQKGLSPHHAFRLEELVARAMGDRLSGCEEFRFDEARARDSVRFFEGEEIPRPGDIPLTIIGVDFTVDISHLTALDPTILASESALFGATASDE